MKAYLAGLFEDRPFIQLAADKLRSLGVEIVSQWIDPELTKGQTREDNLFMDLADVDNSDVLVAFSKSPTTLFVRGGRHVEFGYALKGGKRLVVIGPRENLFHYHPDVEIYATLQEWIDSVEFWCGHPIRTASIAPADDGDDIPF